MNSEFVGESFDDFLKEDNIYDEVNNTVTKRILTFKIIDEMKKQNVTKKIMLENLNISKRALNRVLDPDDNSATLENILKVVQFLNKKLKIDFVDK